MVGWCGVGVGPGDREPGRDSWEGGQSAYEAGFAEAGNIAKRVVFKKKI